LFFEAFGDYGKAHLTNQVLIITSTMKKMEAELPRELFVRVHKSYLINTTKVEYVEGNQIKIGSKLIPIGMSYRENLLKQLG